jgi:hypothetical protein
MKKSGVKAYRSSLRAKGGVGVRILWILLSLCIIASAIAALLVTQQKNQERYSRKATEISEYGLMCVLETLGKKPSWTEGFSKISYDDGWYSANLMKRKKGDTVFCMVEAVGHMGAVLKKTECLIQLSVVNGDSIWIRSGPQ